MLKLELEPTFEFELLGIVSAERGFKLAWLMNHTLGIALKRSADIALDFAKGERAEFAAFQYYTANDSYQLLKNKAIQSWAQKPYLLPEMPNYDYLLKIDNQTGTIDIEAIQAKLSALEAVQYCALLPVETLKSRENLLF